MYGCRAEDKHSDVLGNEASENRSASHRLSCEEIVYFLYENIL